MSKSTIRLLFIIAAVVVIILTIMNIYEVGSQVSDENWYSNQPEGVVIFEVTSGGVSEAAGLQVNDRLVMINGDKIRSANHAQTYLDKAKSGESLIYTIERNGKIMDIRVQLALLGLRIWNVGVFVSGLLFLFFALFVLLIKPDNKFARLLGIACILFAFFLMNIQVAGNIGNRPFWYQLLALLIIVSDFIAIAIFSHTFLYFPEKKYDHINRFWMIYMHYFLAGIMIIISLYIAVTFNYFNPIFLIIPGLYLLGVELVNWKKRRKEYLMRQKIIKYAGMILGISLLFGVLSGVLRNNLIEYLAFVSVVLPLAFFYTTIRYRVYDIYIHIRLSLVYSIIQISLFIGFILSIVFLIRILPLVEIDLPALFMTGTSFEIRTTSQLSPELQQQVSRGYLLLFGILLSLFFYQLKNRIQLLIDRLFFQQKYDYRNALKHFGELLTSYFTREDIGQKSVEQIHEFMKIKGTSLAIAENNHIEFISSRGNLDTLRSKTFRLSPQFVENLVKTKPQLKYEDLQNISGFEEYNKLIYYGTPVVTGQNRLEAIIFTGEKLSESPYNHDDLELLHLFAENLGTAFERARLYEEMSDKERLQREIEIARDIQLNSLPRKDPDYPDLQISSTLTPAAEVGGDYYDYLLIDQVKLGIIVGDVVGKGTSGAIHMSKIQGFLQTLQLEYLEPQVMFERLNTLIRNNFDPEFFFTALYGFFDTGAKKIRIYRMGHNGLIYFNARKQEVQILEPEGIGFGIAQTKKFSAALSFVEVSYERGDVFVLLTDGFLEAMDRENRPFGEDRICNIIRDNADKDATTILNSVSQKIQEYSEGRQQDDATGIVVKIVN